MLTTYRESLFKQAILQEPCYIMSYIIELLHNLTSPEWLMLHGGLYFVMLIVFAETGLFIGFFLPGDSLLFITGMIIANTLFPASTSIVNLLYWILLISVSGILGNYVGYWFGRRSGNMLMERKDSWLFKRKYLVRAKEFYDQKGGSAIVFARFLPVVRTFAPIVAGMVNMSPRKFSNYNIIGSFLWVGTIVTAGYLLGDNTWVKNNLEKIILGIVVVTTAPLLFKMVSAKRKEKLATKSVPAKDTLTEKKHRVP